MDLDETLKQAAARREASARLFRRLPGADAFLAGHDHVPTFHDGEIEEVWLSKKGPGSLSISIFWPDPFGAERILVTFSVANILDVRLEGFSAQNVVGELWLSPATAVPGFYDVEPGDLRLDMEPLFGLSGMVVARGVRLSWAHHRPD